MNKLINWFFTTKLGEWYFEFLLWLDRKNDKPTKYLTPREIAQITRQYSLVHKGVEEVKKKVNLLVTSKSAEEYDKILGEMDDLFALSDYDTNSSEFKMSQLMKSIQVKKGNKDIITHTDKARMIQDRIHDYKQLQDHKLKRDMMRNIRKAKTNGDVKLVEELETKWREKYGNRR